MHRNCFRLDEMDALLDLDPEDPRRKHLSECPLCRARLAAYRLFAAEGAPLPGSEPERAQEELDAFVSRTIEGGGSAPREGLFGARRRWRPFPKRWIVPALAAAAAVIALAVFLDPFPRDVDLRQARLRGLDTTAAGETALTAFPAGVDGGIVTFSWNRLADCDAYEVQIFDESLDEIARFEAAGDTVLRVPVSEIPSADDPVLWRVVSFREGDERARSSLRPLELGPR